MFSVQEFVYIAAMASVFYMVFRIERKLSELSQWLDDYGILQESLLVRYDLLIAAISSISKEPKSGSDTISKKLFEETVKRTREEICSIIVRDFTTKNGKLKKSVAAKIFDEVARKVAKHKSKDT